MTVPTAVDTSVAVPLVVRTHTHHVNVVRWCSERQVALSGHALAETYSVLTRLPGSARLTPSDAARLLAARFAPPLVLTEETAHDLPAILGKLNIAGGAVYDALVALAAKEHDAELATRDSRARATYDAVGVHVAVVA